MSPLSFFYDSSFEVINEDGLVDAEVMMVCPDLVVFPSFGSATPVSTNSVSSVPMDSSFMVLPSPDGVLMVDLVTLLSLLTGFALPMNVSLFLIVLLMMIDLLALNKKLRLFTLKLLYD